MAETQQHVPASESSLPNTTLVVDDTPVTEASPPVGEAGGSSPTTLPGSATNGSQEQEERETGDEEAQASPQQQQKGRVSTLQKGEGSATSPFLTRSTGDGLGHLPHQQPGGDEEGTERSVGDDSEGADRQARRPTSPIPTPTTPLEDSEEDRIILGPSTFNPETGKRVYSQDFLLLFQQLPTCREKPEGLLEIDDIIPGSGKAKGQGGRPDRERSGPGSANQRGPEVALAVPHGPGAKEAEVAAVEASQHRKAPPEAVQRYGGMVPGVSPRHLLSLPPQQMARTFGKDRRRSMEATTTKSSPR